MAAGLTPDKATPTLILEEWNNVYKYSKNVSCPFVETDGDNGGGDGRITRDKEILHLDQDSAEHKIPSEPRRC